MTRTSRIRRRLAARSLGLVVLGFLLTPWATAQEEEQDLRSQPFALPLARDARTLAERAEEHLSAERWSDGLADLQRLLEEHGGDVLPASWHEAANEPSVYASHPGAGRWARRRLSRLPERVRTLYRERYGPVAARALEHARGDGRRRTLTEVARRFPLTQAAADAWRTLGDLEFERGHLESAGLAYERSRDVARLQGFDEASLTGRLARIATLVDATTDTPPAATSATGNDAFQADSGANAPADGTLVRDERFGPQDRATSQNTGLAAAVPYGGSVPRGDADRWGEPLTLSENPLTSDNVIDNYHQFPVLSDDRVFVNTAYRLYAVDAYTGALSWRTDPPSGWTALSRAQRADLAKAIDHEDLVLAPAVGGNIVVGAMQIPYSLNPADKWQGIEIMEAIPQRRLFAFDARTGRELWTHEPPLRWDATQSRFVWDELQGDFAQRMLVAATPVVRDGRLFVPCYRMSGRIEYHVACYEIETGARLWSTPLVSGQRETNMFGRAGQEFVASPVAVSEDVVLAQTELGAVAALDVMTGEILWESLYEQIPLPKTISYQSPKRRATWRIAQPVVCGDVVLSTPRDSSHLVAFRLEDGRVPWSMNQKAHLPRVRGSGELQLNLLLGAEEDIVYLAGESVVALQKPGGLEQPGSRFDVRWSYALENERMLATPRPVLGEREIVVPLRDARIVLDRRTGKPLRLKSATWTFQEYGNVLIGDGTLYTLNRAYLTGFFDWIALLERARVRLARSLGEPEVVRETAELFVRRGEALAENGDPAGALSIFSEARRLLEGQRSDASDPDLDEHLFRVLCNEARVHTTLAAVDAALDALERARPLAPTPHALRDVLVHRERLVRGSDVAQRLAIYAELEARCSGLPLGEDTLREGPDWLIGESLFDPEELAGWQRADLPMGLWVLLSRADFHARLRQSSAALDDLHGALARYGERALRPNLSVGDIVTQRLERRLQLDGREPFQPFEDAALALFDAAAEAHDARLLEEVARLYPLSEAALAARRTRLSWAYSSGDAQTVVELAYESLTSGTPLTEDDALALLRVGTVLGRRGNRELQRLVLAAVAAAHPDLSSDLVEHGGRSLSELAAEHTFATPTVRRPQPSFDSTVRKTKPVVGNHVYIGALPLPVVANSDSGDLAHVYLRGQSLRAFSTANPSDFLWPPVELPFGRPVASLDLSQTRIVAGGRSRILAFDADGVLAWSHELAERIENVTVHEGLALVLAGPRTSPDRLYAFDAHDGLFLWELVLPEAAGGIWQPPVCGENQAAVFLQRTSQPASVAVVDLVRGRRERFFDLEPMVGSHIENDAWIDSGVLFVPTFRRRTQDQSTLSAYGLDSGGPLWSVPLPANEALTATLHCKGRDYLATVGTVLDGGGTSGAIYLLEDPLIGVVRPIVRFRAGESPIGLDPRRRRIHLDEPLLFLESLVSGANTTPVRAVRLPEGSGWTYTLPVAQEDLQASGLPLPAVTDTTVALAYVKRDRKRSGLNNGVGLVFLERESGLPLDRRDLDLGLASQVELRGLGPALFVVARGKRPDSSRIVILETPQ